jgi:hypothetical protein
MKQFIGFELVVNNALYDISISANSVQEAISKIKSKYNPKYWILCPMSDKYLKDDAEDIIENVITTDYRKYCCRNNIRCCLDLD